MQLQCIEVAMKTTSLPPLRVSPALRKAAEAVLEEGESLSALVLGAVTRDIEVRKQERDFIARGLSSSRQGKANGQVSGRRCGAGKVRQTPGNRTQENYQSQ